MVHEKMLNFWVDREGSSKDIKDTWRIMRDLKHNQILNTKTLNKLISLIK